MTKRGKIMFGAWATPALIMLALAGCAKIAPAECKRKSDGAILTGTAYMGDPDQKPVLVYRYEMVDANGLTGAIDASNSSSFVCKVEGVDIQ